MYNHHNTCLNALRLHDMFDCNSVANELLRFHGKPISNELSDWCGGQTVKALLLISTFLKGLDANYVHGKLKWFPAKFKMRDFTPGFPPPPPIPLCNTFSPHPPSPTSPPPPILPLPTPWLYSAHSLLNINVNIWLRWGGTKLIWFSSGYPNNLANKNRANKAPRREVKLSWFFRILWLTDQLTDQPTDQMDMRVYIKATCSIIYWLLLNK